MQYTGQHQTISIRCGAVLFITLLCVIFLSNSPLFAQEQPRPLSAATVPEREYVIGTNDQLAISEWQSPKFSTQGRVRTDGKITIPYLGDIQAAGLKVSTFRAHLERDLKKYLKDPMVNLTVGTSGNIRVTVNGVITQEAEIARGTTLLQLLRSLLPTLQPLQPPPNLTELKIIGSDNEEYRINGLDLLAAKTLEANLRLEWGDQIYIPSTVEPTPTAIVQPQQRMFPENRQATLTQQDIDSLSQQFPEAQAMLQELLKQTDEETFLLDLAALSDEQRETLGDEMLRSLEQYIQPPAQEFTQFSDIALMGININLAVEETLEAYLALPNSTPRQFPTIQRFREGELIQQGKNEAENIFLEQIQESENQVILRQGEKLQRLQISPAFSQAKLSGIYYWRNEKKAFFSSLRPSSTSNRPVKRRMFQETESIEENVLLAKIAENWVLLQQGDALQLVLLRDARNRLPSPSTPAQIPTSTAQIPTESSLSDLQVPAAEAIRKALPPPIQALDSLSKLFFATSLF